MIKKFVFSPILTKLSEIVVLMSTVISPSLVKIGLKTKNFYHYAKFCRDPFLNCNYSSLGQFVPLFSKMDWIGVAWRGWQIGIWSHQTMSFGGLITGILIVHNVYHKKIINVLNICVQLDTSNDGFWSYCVLIGMSSEWCLNPELITLFISVMNSGI